MWGYQAQPLVFSGTHLLRKCPKLPLQTLTHRYKAQNQKLQEHPTTCNLRVNSLATLTPPWSSSISHRDRVVMRMVRRPLPPLLAAGASSPTASILFPPSAPSFLCLAPGGIPSYTTAQGIVEKGPHPMLQRKTKALRSSEHSNLGEKLFPDLRFHN